MAAALYDPAFATLGRIFGKNARAPITTLTLAGGFASTVSWPATQILIDHVGWRGAYLVYAALLAWLAAPLHAFALPRRRARPDAPERPQEEQQTPHWRKSPLRCCRRTGLLSSWWRRRSPLMRSFPRRSPRSFSPSSSVSVLRPQPSSPSACCSARRKFWRASANSPSRAICIRCGPRGFPSGCWWRRSCC